MFQSWRTKIKTQYQLHASIKPVYVHVESPSRRTPHETLERQILFDHSTHFIIKATTICADVFKAIGIN